ncbi:MAG: adenylate/guanylate cyclase domain-containing protein [Phycisphaerales bacterium]|nr:adenylate/guanylate cyclase domain-containing protein [Phycisphaerales bacterium]
MRIPLRFSSQSTARKILAAVVVAAVAIAILMALRFTPGVSVPLKKLDNVLYDSMYALRTPQSRLDGDIVIVAVDDRSTREMSDLMDYGWPWPRVYWGLIAQYVSHCGARAVGIDLLFTEKSRYVQESPDDDDFAAQVAKSTSPVVYAAVVRDGKWGNFAPPIPDPIFGAANASNDAVIRTYWPQVEGKSSFAVAVASAAKGHPVAQPAGPFLLHYYGPTRSEKTPKGTFRYLSAVDVVGSAMRARKGKPGPNDIPPETFKDKIVLIGVITAGGYDLKVSPLSDIYPGTEVHATAIENLLHGQFVRPLGPGSTGLIGLMACLVASLGGMIPKRVILKLLWSVVALVALLVVAVLLFRGGQITWLPLAAPLVAVILATIGAFAWSYLTEDRQRRVVLKALGQYVSPTVAAQIARNPDSLKLGGERREMTVMFTDIAGFTDLSETLSVEKLSALLNFYLDEMSSVVIENDGTLDKYVGDAIMSFWSAPVLQDDHAVRACRAALGMKRREEAIQDQLRQMGAGKMFTRIGLNTGPMSVGNMGSSRKFNYTVLGDSVNLGSRLEGANKFYGTRIMLADSTAKQVQGQFLLRPLDVLRVKGKQQPMAVFELMDEGPGEEKLRDLAKRYESAFVLYQQRQWDAAEKILLELQQQFADDGPTATLLARISKFHKEPPPSNWDGVYVAKDK